jgi:hypothetical protein
MAPPLPSTAAEIVDAISALEDAKAQASAAQARLTARLLELTGATDRDGPRSVASQVAMARRESPAHGQRYVGLARALVDELPATLAALESGALSEWRATLITRETACLAPDDRALVDVLVCTPDPATGRHPFHGWGDRRLVAEVRRHVASLDPAAVVDRRAGAERERRVSLRPAPDTMAQLSALLPAAQGVAVWATLTRVADQAIATGDARSRGQIMADTVVERITGQTRADAVPVAVDLVVSDQTLLAGGAEPAWLQGYGPLTAQTARDLCLAADRDALAQLRRLYATPDTGTLVAMDSRARRFPHGLATFIELRDRTCRTPWCDAPVRQIDHVLDAARGGPTSADNGQGLCQHCNLVKQATGWRTRPLTGPPGSPHTVETTLPTGHTLVSTAPATPRPAPSQIRVDHEWLLRALVLAS